MHDKLPFELKSARGAPRVDQYGLPLRGRARVSASIETAGRGAALWVFAAIALSVTLLQKIGYGTAPDGIVPVVVPLTLVAMLAGIALARPVFDAGRAGLYFLFVIDSGLTTALFATNYSFKSFALFAILYLPLIVAFRVSDATYRRCMDFFSTLMVVMVGIVLVQHLVQLSIGWQYWPNLDRLLPPSLLIPYFNYVQPIVWGMNYMKPNGVFFLEVSFLSQFIALALGIELVVFRRWWRIALFTMAVFITFAGTGLLLLLLTVPVLIGRVSIRNMLFAIAVFALVGLLAWWLGWADLVSHRFDEFSRTGASANMRFVEPYNRLVEFASDPNSLYRGIGAGQIEKALNFQWWPITKAILEYGIIPGLLFYGFFLYTLFNRAPRLRIAYMLAVWFSFEGALLTAVNPITCMLLSTMFVIDDRRGSVA
jgi:hypothetical protein